MDTEAATTQMKQMFSKARAARKEGKKELAGDFRAAGTRLQRKLKAAKIATPPPKKVEEAES